MDDLISRKALLNDLCQDREEGTFEFSETQAEAANKIVRYVTGRIEAQHSVPAVPLDKLCKWMAEHSIGIPCESCRHFSNDYCTAIGDMNNPCPNKAEDWQRAIKGWMEGLNV